MCKAQDLEYNITYVSYYYWSLSEMEKQVLVTVKL